MTTATEDNKIPKDIRHGRRYNKEELKNYKKITDQILGNFDFQLQELHYEIDTNNKEIHTEEIRSILKGIEQLCDDIDGLVEESNKK